METVQLIAICYFTIASGLFYFVILLAKEEDSYWVLMCQLSFIALVFFLCGCHYISEKTPFHFLWDKYVLLPFALIGSLFVNPFISYLVFKIYKNSILELKKQNQRLINIGLNKAKGLNNDNV